MASKLRSMMGPSNHRQSRSEIRTSSPAKKENIKPQQPLKPGQDPFLPPDHPHTRQHLRESNRLRDNARSPPKKPIEVYEDDSRNPRLHKRTKSSVSLKSLIGNDKIKTPKPASPEKQTGKKPVKSKSSTSLSALMSRPKSSKGSNAANLDEPKDKENHTPPRTGDIAPPPIWAQFSSQPMEGFGALKIPPNDVDHLADDMALYTPQVYSPSKQRNFGDYERPTLSRGMDRKPRPKSAALPSASSNTSFTGTLSRLRKRSEEKEKDQQPFNSQQSRNSKQESRTASTERKLFGRGINAEQERTGEEVNEPDHDKASGGSRVMAAVAVFNDKARGLSKQPLPTSKTSETPLDRIAINHAFEELLDSRNIPQNVRDKMRSLNTKIKADFVRKETSIIGPVSGADCFAQQFSGTDAYKRPKSWYKSGMTNGSEPMGSDANQTSIDVETPKKSRPRSLTFTRSKGDSNPKKERPMSHSRTKSSDSTSVNSFTSSTTAQGLPFLNRTPKVASPEDCISYLKKVRQPQLVEVGRIQKLRQLLRNETVSWVDAFVDKGGMTEVVGLLYRIIEIEWREEHEDTLLHETLLCLKALCTTTSALRRLVEIQSALFPTLLGMLFDKERKGPSEFITRGIIISLLFTYLSTAPPDLRDSRAQTLLCYLRDPSKPDEAQPPGFITSIYQARPYRTWCNEMVSVTKEVFWIFMHHGNIVPYPSDLNEAASYSTKHFPGERPPVPAAPYIGGVEWDATNYVAAHVDLLNGLIASLSSFEERNALRQQLKDSGFEKCMGVSLRTCKEKFYGAVHAGLTTWIGAAREDGWDVKFVKEGPRQEDIVRTSSPKKRKHEEPPRLDIPKLDLGVAVGGKESALDEGRWL